MKLTEHNMIIIYSFNKKKEEGHKKMSHKAPTNPNQTNEQTHNPKLFYFFSFFRV